MRLSGRSSKLLVLVNLDFIHQSESDPAVSLVSLGQISGVTIAYPRDILTDFHLKMFQHPSSSL